VIQALTFAAYAITLDGKTVLPHARAAVSAGHVLLPVRTLGNALGADVGYDGRAHTITVQRGAHVATISARGAVRIVNGTAYAPLRAVATAFGLNVGYDARMRTVALAGGGANGGGSATSSAAQRGAPGGAGAPAQTGANAGGQAGATGRQGAFIVTETPRNAAQVHEPYPAISARFAGAAAIDPRSLHVVVDGRDVTGDASVVGDQVLYTPRTALSPGTHYVVVTGRDAASGAALGDSWSFDDSFAFTTAPAPTPFPIAAMWVDRYIFPGTNAFDVYVEGAPGMTGYVGVDGVGGIFPLTVYSANAYVAHVFVPNGVNQPYARVAARITLPNGQPQTIVLPQTFNLVTPPITRPAATTPNPTPTPRASPVRRSVDVPTPTPTPGTSRRSVLTATPTPSPARTPTAAPAQQPVSPAQTRPPTVSPVRTPVASPVRTLPPALRTLAPTAKSTPAPSAQLPAQTIAPASAPAGAPTPAATPLAERTRKPLVRRTPPPPTPRPAEQ
jgi:Copper amine oxidase N-terminal domain